MPIYLGKSKITQLDKALEINEDILWFEIPIHNVVVVQVLQGQHNGANVELGQLLIHALQHLHLYQDTAMSDWAGLWLKLISKYILNVSTIMVSLHKAA